jgi:deoxyribodipyrimidine photo-lyase
MSPQAEAFLDEAVTWRELGYNFASHRSDAPDDFETLPRWAISTLAKHEKDPRPVVYTTEELDAANTLDPLWNAAMTQMKREGWMHGYLRMLWGKKILEWSPTPRAALASMEHLMNRYSVDGRDPNSYSGFFWVLGRYDRPWGPERKIFGSVRYMSSTNTGKKMPVKKYIEAYQSPLRSDLR